MAHNLTESQTFATNVTVPDPGDPRDAAGIELLSQQLANRTKWLREAGAVSPVNAYRLVGLGRSWGGAHDGTFATTSVIAVDTLYAVPFIAGDAGGADITASELGARVTTAGGAGEKFRVGIYSATALNGPDALVVDSGELAADGIAVVEATIAELLTQGELYWLAIVTNSATAQFQKLVQQGAPLGMDASYNAQYHGLSVAHAFAALPDPFTGGSAGVTTQGTIPLIGVGFTL